MACKSLQCLAFTALFFSPSAFNKEETVNMYLGAGPFYRIQHELAQLESSILGRQCKHEALIQEGRDENPWPCRIVVGDNIAEEPVTAITGYAGGFDDADGLDFSKSGHAHVVEILDIPQYMSFRCSAMVL